MDTMKTSAKISLCVLFCVLGFIGNWFKVELFFNVDYLFGSFFVMLAIMILGGTYAVTAGFVAGTCTYFLWNHPWGIVILSAEALFVSILYSRKKGNPVLYDMLYWVCIGMPLVYLFLHHVMAISTQTTALVMLKNFLNGVLNSLMASLLFTGMNLRKSVARSRIAYSHSIFIVMVSLVLMPAMVLYVIGIQVYLRKEKEALAARVSYTSEIARSSLANWIKEHHQNIQTLAAIVGDPDVTGIEEMQRRVEMIKAVSPAFNRMGVLDKNAVTIAYSPLKDENGKSNLGLDFSDRPFIPILKETKRPYVSGVVMGRIGNPAPMVPLLAPIIVEGVYKGYCTGILELPQISNMISVLANQENYNISVVDNQGKVVASTIPSLQVMEPFERPYAGEGKIWTPDVLHWIPDPQAGISVMQRWRSSLIVRSVAVAPDYAWKLIVEAPMLPVVERVSRHGIHWLALLCILTIVTMILSHLFSRAFVSTVARLQEMTRTFPQLMGKGAQIKWPESKIVELEELSNNFQAMSLALSDSLQQQMTLNETLEERVNERTRELHKTNGLLQEEVEEHKRTAAALSQSEDMARRLFRAVEQSPVTVVITDLEGKIEYVNAKFEETTGYSKEEAKGQNPHILKSGEMPPEGYKELWETITSGNDWKGVFHNKRKNGELYWENAVISPMRNGLGEITHFLALKEDITELLHTQEQLKTTAQLFNTILSSLYAGILVVGNDDRVKFTNQSFCKLFDFKELPEDLCGFLGSAIIEKTKDAFADPARELPHIRKILADNEPVKIEELSMSGGRTYLRDFIPISMDGKRYGRVWLYLDITDRKQTESALKEAHNRLDAIVEFLPDATLVIDAHGTVIAWNRAIEEMTGIPKAQMLHRGNYEYAVPFYGERRPILIDLALQDVHALFEGVYDHIQRDGDRYCGEIYTPQAYQGKGAFLWGSASLLRDSSGEVAGAIETIRDISERKRFEEERKNWEHRLHQIQKAESLSRMAGAIAHNFNNMLGAVIGNLEMVLDDLPQGSGPHEGVAEALKASHRAAEIGRFMLAYLGQSVGKREVFDLADLIRDTAASLRASLPQNVGVETELPSQRSMVRANKAHLVQVLSNLVTNAVEAIGERNGHIRLGICNVEAEKIEKAKLLPFDWEPKASAYACFSVLDTGCGVGSDHYEKIFDPFFSTKFTGRGLGLPVVLGLVRAHGGAVGLESQVGKGAKFSVYLPL